MAGTGEAGKPAADPGTFSGIEDMDDEDSQEGKFLTFKLGDEEFGIEIRNVTEIIGLQKISKVPDMPGFIKGVINLRGNVIPVIDLPTRLKLSGSQRGRETRVLIVKHRAELYGIVEQTSEYWRLEGEQGGELFVLEASGLNADVDIRITNLVQTSGSAVLRLLASFVSSEHLAGLTFVPPAGESGDNRLLSPDYRPLPTPGRVPRKRRAVFRGIERKGLVVETTGRHCLKRPGRSR